MKGRILLIAMVLVGKMLLTGCTESLDERKEKAIKNIEDAHLKELSEAYKKKQKDIVDAAKKDIEKTQDIVEVKRTGDDAEYRIKLLNDLTDYALVVETKGVHATISLPIRRGAVW